MYTLKSIARRGTLLGAAFALLAAAIMPALPVYADALNPLYERSLTLSSGSPGWSYTDASGNPTYAPPNSGANGQKSGNTFGFRVSSTASVKGFSFQYCTTSAGNCMGPGDNGCASGTTGGGDCVRKTNAQGLADKTSDLKIVASTPTEVSTFGTKFNTSTGVPSSVANVPNRDNSEGNFIVLHKTNPGDAWTQDTGWAMAASVKQTVGGSAGTIGAGTSTGQENYITLSKAAGVSLTAGDYVKVIFFGTDTNYITNPGSKEFYVKLNTYNSDTTLDDTTLVDGGVTVANVMNLSIEIQTKVLETMDFSVGVVDPNTLDSTDGTGAGGVNSEFEDATGSPSHSTCDRILPGLTTNPTTPNVLQMGDANGEFSLRTDTTYSTHSYWRLSSNSSAGATVYYSGVTLSNTVGDQIDAIGPTADVPKKGAEQFGLALANGTASNYDVSYAVERNDADHLFENAVDNGKTGIHTASLTADGVIANASWHTPKLSPLVPTANYGDGTGVVNSNWAGGSATVDTSFAFDPNSNLIPVAVASENNQVVDCVTGKVRYIANIAATTPAGIYTTKINWIAAPQY